MSFLTKFFSGIRQRKQVRRYESGLHGARKAYLLDQDTPFAITEAFRNLKATLSVSVPRKENGEGVSLLMTSTFPEEGKTTVTVNLALMFAISNVRVALVDADIRKGRICKYFKQKAEPGLSDYLSGQAKYEDIIRPTEQNKNLFIVCSGTQSPRPYELLESDAMKELSDRLKKEFDYIIYDTPPIKLVSDALAVLPVTDGTVLITRYMQSYESDIKSSLDSIRFAKGNVLGMIVNDYYVPPKKMKKNQGHYYAYYESEGENTPRITD